MWRRGLVVDTRLRDQEVLDRVLVVPDLWSVLGKNSSLHFLTPLTCKMSTL